MTDDLTGACEMLVVAEKSLSLAQQRVELAAKALHGTLPIRTIARQSQLSAATVSNFFRGRLVVSSKNALRLARIARDLV